MQTDALIVGSGISAYFCSKNIENKIVISNNKKNNSLLSGKSIRISGIKGKSLKDSLNESGRNLGENEKINYLCKNINSLKELSEFKETNYWKDGFRANFSFLKDFQKKVIQAELIDIIIEKKKVVGAKIKVNDKNKLVKCKCIVLCTGGYTQYFQHTDSAKYSKISPLEIAFEKGARVKDLEFIFYHPFGTKGKIIPLDLLKDYKIIDSNGKEDNEIENLLKNNEAHHLISKISSRIINNGGEITAILENSKITLSPIAHTTLGGLITSKKDMTNINGLFAAGEITSGLNGADRLGGIALSDAIIFGNRAGKNANEYCKKTKFEKTKLTKNQIKLVKKNTLSSKKILSKYFKLINSENNLKAGLNRSIQEKNLFCQAIFIAALKRKESRGCFHRSDYPYEREEFEKNFIFSIKNGKLIELK
jgi:succinate dehydrogenase/fumarate reductase flavoprotein subunit